MTPAPSSAIKPTGEKVAALDVADGGKDRSALTVRYGVQVELCKSRGDLHADGAGAWAYAIAAQNACQRLLYDNIGVGAGAAASLRGKNGHEGQGLECGGAVVNRSHKYQGTRRNEDMFANAKAQAGGLLRDRFFETFKAGNGEPYDPDAIISLSPAIEELRELKSELLAGDVHVQPGGQGPRQQGTRRSRKSEPCRRGDDRVRASQHGRRDYRYLGRRRFHRVLGLGPASPRSDSSRRLACPAWWVQRARL